jgi:ABC-type nitrate/sulfonate/bicarbonate transport system permease component
VPVVAILPLALLLFGTTLRMKYSLVAFGVFWPLVIQVIYGVRSIDPTIKDTAKALQVRGVRRFAVVVMPSAAPFIATGLRVAAATALILDIVAELIGGGQGLGLRILTALNSGPGAYPIMYAYIVATGVLGLVLAGTFLLLERRFLHWHESQRHVRESARAA